MSTTVNINSAYKGEQAGKIFTQIFLKADTLEKQAVRVIPNVVGTTAYLVKTELSDAIIDYSCSFEPSGNLDLTEKEVKLKKLQLPLEICKETFRQRWEASQMGFSAWNDEIPANEKEAIMLEVAGLIAQQTEQDIWNGDGSAAGHFEGIVTELKADGDANNVDGAVLTVTNIIDAMGAVLDATPVAVMQRADFTFAMDVKSYGMYKRALGNMAFAQNVEDFEGHKITVLNGLPANSILTYAQEQVVFLTGLLSDFNDIRVLDMTEHDLSDNIRIKAQYLAGASYSDAENITYYNAQ